MQQPFTELSVKGCCVSQRHESDNTVNRYFRLSIAFLALGCSSTASSPGPVLGPAPNASAPGVSLPGSSGRSWTITPATEPRRYSSTATVSLELVSDSATIREAITQRTRFTLLTGSASGSTSFLGSVEALSTDTPARIGQPAPLPVFPISFTGHIVNGTITLDALNGQSAVASMQCSNPAVSALNVVQRNVIILPTQLTQGMTWRDSTTAAGCSGSIPITTISIRNYRVIGEIEVSGRAAIAIERTEKTLSTGEGSENQHRVLLRTEATGNTKIYVDRFSGALLSSEGEQRADVTVAAGRAQRFKQTVKETTTVEN